MSPASGAVTELATGVRRVLAPNPGMMTGPGTNTYLLGEKEIAVLDPGPAIRDHVEAIQWAAGGTIRWILVTHTHRDHSPAARPLAEATGASLLGRSPPPDETQDKTFAPDRVLEDGDRFETAELSLTAVHTPGHASNHLCYLHEDLKWLFTGDHLMGGSTVVINPPDGNMKDYLESLVRLKRLGLARLVPGHGEPLDDPDRVIEWTIAHRLEREAKIIAALEETDAATVAELVTTVYEDVDRRLHDIAQRSLLAHLIKLRDEDRAQEVDARWSLKIRG